MTQNTDYERVTLTVTIDIVKDGTEDVPAILADIVGHSGTLDVAAYRFALRVESAKPTSVR